MVINQSVLSAITIHATKELPHEACGYLAERNGIIEQHYEMTNIDKAADHFSMNPSEQFAAIKEMRKQGQKLAAVYHSHPETPARPSEEDIRLAYDPGISHVIISLAVPESISVKAYKITSGQVFPENIEITPEASKTK